MSVKSLFEKIIKLLNKTLFHPAPFGFISPQVNLSKDEILFAESLIGSEEGKLVADFEREFASHIGVGRCVAFAAGRMAFYAILKSQNIGKGDEVALTGFTCSVMVNAVLRVGATPVFVDIDRNTLGTSPEDLQKKLTSRTKLIVAQNTFGIPCEIDKIKEIARKNDCFLVEDCALTLGTRFKGVVMGDWGDASIFSIDHTKPLNALIGGLAYTKDTTLEAKLRQVQSDSALLTPKHQRLVLRRYLRELSMEKKGHASFIRDGYWITIRRKLGFKVQEPYLESDSGAMIEKDAKYSYPSKMPELIAYLGIKSLRDYYDNIEERKRSQNEIICCIEGKETLPSMLYSKEVDFLLLRVPILLTDKSISDYGFIDDWVWFKTPIIATSYPIESLGYNFGSCPVSEAVGKMIMNLPIIFETKARESLIKKINNIYK